MSAEDMRRLSVQRIEELSKSGIEKLRRLRHSPAQIVSGERGIASAPATTAEAIGLLACEINAELTALDRAVEIINDTYKMLTSPAAEPEEKSEAKQEKFY